MAFELRSLELTIMWHVRCRMRYGGDLEDVSERLEVDMRTSAGLEGYRRNLGEELDSVRKKIGSTAVH